MITFPKHGWGIAWDDPDKKTWAIGAWWDDDNDIGCMFMSYRRIRAYRLLIWPKISIARIRDWMGPDKPVGSYGLKKEIL